MTWNNLQSKDDLFEYAHQKFLGALQKRGYISVKRIDEEIKDFLEDNDLLSTDSFQKLYHPSDIEKFKPETIKDKKGHEHLGLGSPDIGSIKNPMAMRTLHQLRKLVNTLILEDKIDTNTKINIELVRELNDSNKRKAIEKWQNDRKDLFQEYEKKIKELYKEETGKEIGELTDNDIEKFGFALEQREDGKIVSKEDLTKYKLWEEQNHICIYTGKTISLAGFLDAKPAFDIEHTLPRSRSWDNSLMNKTLCDSTFNRDLKGNRTPFELKMDDEILPRIEHWKKRYEDLGNEIEKLKRQSRNAADKEQKDRIIQKRHYLQMDYNYWKGKYERFTKEEITEGFKNSQYVDAGIISKYAVAYMKSVFNKVYTVKGEMVDQYRKAWGLHETFKDKWGRTQYKPKDRSNHIHHCIDAVTIACLNKGKYDKLAHAWGLEDKGDFKAARKELEKEKPWEKFTEDVKNLVNEVFIVHQNKNVLPIQTKKKFRKRGKIQYRLVDQLPDDFLNKKEGKDYFIVENNGIRKYRVPIFQQGDTVRGSLHLESFYGAIANDKNGQIKKDKNDNLIPNYVVRKELSKLKKSDIPNIVDKNVRAIVEQAEKDKRIVLGANGSKVNEPLWQNEEKQIPLKKVRVYTPSVKTPLQGFKKHYSPFLSEKEYKQQFNVVNEENYCLAIYEGMDNKGKVGRAYEILNNIDAGEYFKQSNKSDRKRNLTSLVPEIHLETNYELLKYKEKPVVLRKGIGVILLSERNEKIDFSDYEFLKNRLYNITGLDSDGIKVMYHQSARGTTESIVFMNGVIDKQTLFEVRGDLETIGEWNRLLLKFSEPDTKKTDFFKEVNQILNKYYSENELLDNRGRRLISKIKQSSLTTPKGGDILNRFKEFPYVKFKVNNFHAKIEGIDFKITPTGQIQKL